MAFAIFIGEIDVSVGANLGFTATVVGTMLRDGSNWGAAFAAGILVGLLIGLFNGWGVAVMGVPSLIFTLGTNGVMRGMMYVYSGGNWIENLPQSFKNLYTVKAFGPVQLNLVIRGDTCRNTNDADKSSGIYHLWIDGIYSRDRVYIPDRLCHGNFREWI